MKWLRSCKIFKVHLRPPKLFKTIQGSYSLAFSRKVLKSASQFSRPGKCVQNKDEVRENSLETVVDIAKWSRNSQWCRMRSFTPRCTVDIVRLQCIMGKPRFCVCRGLYWSLILIKIEAGHRNYCFRKVWKKSCIRIQTSVRTVNCITMNFEGCQSHGRIVVIDYKFLPFCWQGLPL